MRSFRAVVIGAGPAGLSAAAVLSGTGKGPCLLVEAGAPAVERDRHDAHDLLAGIGGAGLFSDGKHSFYPSATALWALPDRAALAAAFEATAALLARFAVDAGALPAVSHAPAAASSAEWLPKRYPSIYVSLAARMGIIQALTAATAEYLTGARVVAAHRAHDGRIEIAIERAGLVETVRAEQLVIAGGRWAPLAMRAWLGDSLGVRFDFLRVEFGVRIELGATAALFEQLPGVDGKVRFVDDDAGIEIRTFCTCRNGEVLLGESAGRRAFSGRADGPPTGRSNVGLVVRSRDPCVGRDVLNALATATPRSFALDEWRSRGAAALTPSLGATGAELLSRALEQFVEYCPALATATGTLHAPALEGVGDYPIDDGDLQLAPGVWVAGDACGRFRGIVAALISGGYVARRMNAR